jgi:hypothetical protein
MYANFTRRSTPVPCGHVLFGFFGSSMSRTGSHPRRPDLARRGSRVAAPSQALKNALRCVFHHAISHPRQQLRVPGASAAKTLTDRGTAQATESGPAQEPLPGLVRVVDAAPRSRRVFLALGPAARVACEGCGGGRAMDTARRARRLALAANRDAAQRSAAAVRVREVRARPGRRSTGKTRRSTCSISAHGRRPAMDTKSKLYLHRYPAFIKNAHGRRPAKKTRTYRYQFGGCVSETYP